MGEVGRRLAAALGASGWSVIPVTRTAGWENLASEDGPVLVCVREEALTDLLPRLAGVAPERLVFVQNGWVGPLLSALPTCTRGLIWFTSKGEFFKILRPSPFCGPLARTLVPALEAGGIPATSLEASAFVAQDIEKMGFNCVVGLPLAVHRLSLGDYLASRREEAHAVFSETVAVLEKAVGASVNPEAWEAFLSSAAPLHWVRVSAPKALALRNGAVVREARRLGLAAPVNERLLAAVA